MRRIIHDCWPLAAVFALTTILALQIPRRAIFFAPVPVAPPTSFASFVTYDAATYELIMQKVRMSWQMRNATESTFESRGDALDFVGDEPRLSPLGLPPEFSVRRTFESIVPPPVPLLPPSVADRSALVPVAVPPDDGQETRDLRADLLSIPESLQSNE